MYFVKKAFKISDSFDQIKIIAADHNNVVAHGFQQQVS